MNNYFINQILSKFFCSLNATSNKIVTNANYLDCKMAVYIP